MTVLSDDGVLHEDTLRYIVQYIVLKTAFRVILQAWVVGCCVCAFCDPTNGRWSQCNAQLAMELPVPGFRPPGCLSVGKWFLGFYSYL